MASAADSSQLEAVLSGARGGTTRRLVIEGEIGSGRTHVLDSCRAAAASEHMRVLSTQGRRIDRSIGFSGLLTLLAGVEPEIDSLAGDHATALRSALSLGREATEVLDVGIGVFRLLAGLAERCPLLVAVDDADLIDEPTAEALGFALGRLDADAVAAILVMQPSSRSPLSSIADDVIVVRPRSVSQLANIVTQQVDVDPSVAMRVGTAAAGNPLVALALARALTDRQRSGLEQLPKTPAPPEALVREFESRLDDAGEPVRRALVLVAADRGGDRSTLEAALVRLGEPPESIRLAIEHGVAVSDGTTVRLAHPLLQKYAYRQVTFESRRAAHQALAEEYGGPSDAAARVWHLAAAAEGDDEELAAALDLVAAESRSRLDVGTAIEALQKATELSSDLSANTARLRLATRLAIESGDADTARQVLERAPAAETEHLRAVAAHISDWSIQGTRAPASADDQIDEANRTLDAWAERLSHGDAAGVAADSAVPIPWDPCLGAALRIRALVASGLIGPAEAFSSGFLAGLVPRSVPAAVVASARAEALMWSGDRDGAATLLEWARPVLAASAHPARFAEATRTAGRLALATGDVTTAIDLFEAVPASQVFILIDDLVWALLRDRQSNAADRWLQSVQTHHALLPALSLQRAQGLLEGDASRVRIGVTTAEEAGLPLEAALSRMAEGEILQRQGDVPAARGIEADCRMALRPLGARLPLSFDLLAAGVDPTRDEVPQVGPDPIDLLSPAEQRVAVTVARGCTNKEAAAELFLSVKTVDFHLQSIYRKLLLRSRTELAVLMSTTRRST